MPDFLSTPGSVADWTLLAHAAATFTMVGIIWVVQRVHYALFDGVGAEGYADYQRRHMARITPVVGAPMLVEAGTGVALLFLQPRGVGLAPIAIGLALLAVIWGSTALLQVPRHARLVEGFDAAAHRGLVASNWIRTVAWTLRGALVLWMLARAMGQTPA